MTGLGDKVEQVPYRLPDLIAAIEADRTIPVSVPEGEGKVNVLRQLGIPATHIAKGTKNYAELFRDADVNLIPDNDDAGYAHINEIGAALSGIAKRVRVLVLPGLDRGGDIKDWAKAGGTVDQFWELVEAAPEWSPPSPSSATAASSADDDQLHELVQPKQNGRTSTGAANFLQHAPTRA